MLESKDTPRGKSVIATCPAVCDKYSCGSCTSNPACAWFADSSLKEDDECDLREDKHFTQTAVTEPASCKACAATRCYECNNMDACGWYVKKFLGKAVLQGCFAKSDTAAHEGRELRAITDKNCEGVPNSSGRLAASMGVLMLAFFLCCVCLQ